MATRKLILIVDDEPIELDLLEVMLTREGYRVARAPDGRQALELARKLRPSVVVTDILMPNMDGYQLCREISRDPELSDIPVVFYSATYTDPEDQELARDVGAAKFIVKPSDTETFRQVFSEILTEPRRDGPARSGIEPPDDSTFLSQYNKRLVAKLEKKLGELNDSKRNLEEQVKRAQEAENEIRRLAYVDGITGLPSRVSLLEVLGQKLASNRDAATALLCVDVDSFREINHAIGFERGNLLLREIAHRIIEAAGQGASSVARVGRDEFAVVIDDSKDMTGLQATATDITTAFDRPFEIDGLTVDVTVSIGIAVSPQHAQHADLLLRHAGVALHSGRGSRGLVAIYDPTDDPYEPGRVRLITGIRQAIRDDRLVVHYQPKINLAQGTTVGLEALIRWDHPEHGILAPDTFISIAEQTGLVRPLGRWLFRRVLTEQARLRDEGSDLEVSINLSTRNLMDESLPDQFMEEVVAHGLDWPRVTLEITESSILKDPQQAQSILERLSTMGMEVAIDDFGTGYSSLMLLKLLPVRELKIDRSFIIDMGGKDDDDLIVRSIIDLAHALDLRVTAEGVENESALTRLTHLGCDMAQGFYMARPMPYAALRDWLCDSPWGQQTASS